MEDGLNGKENIHSPIPENVDVPIPKNIHSPIPENADIPIPENNHISQTQFQKADLDSLDYDPGIHKQIWEYHVADIIEKAPKNAIYTSPKIQKEILHVYLDKVKKAILEEIGDAKFCIMVDEARDKSMKEQMVVVFRYVDREGIVKERFFGLIHVVDTATLTLKKGIYSLLSQHYLDIQNIQEQGYDGVSYMRVLLNIIDDASDGEHRAEAESAYDGLTSFELVFILQLEKETMEITDKLCQALQSQSQDILNAMHLVSSNVINSVSELNHRFNEDAMELLRLSLVLEPQEALKSFRSSGLCLLVKNFYPQDFTDYDKQVLEKELCHFEHNVVQDPEFKKLNSLSELYQWLVRTGNSEYYKLVYRMVRLVLSLPVSTATIERTFSAMKVVKTNLRNKI
ncbi:uncharacterized protein LOC126689935 [Quercus robur]|uniref:uncharacterized protein LOC126689935 n=1 Tax=Quercus robur TaxID=38942 RepID=UPI002162297E|nr:uncharacterized protein LOC126689935 [Quercus robur]